MCDFVNLFARLTVTVVRLVLPGGLRSVVGESVLVKHQLQIHKNGRCALKCVPRKGFTPGASVHVYAKSELSSRPVFEHGFWRRASTPPKALGLGRPPPEAGPEGPRGVALRETSGTTVYPACTSMPEICPFWRFWRVEKSGSCVDQSGSGVRLPPRAPFLLRQLICLAHQLR